MSDHSQDDNVAQEAVQELSEGVEVSAEPSKETAVISEHPQTQRCPVTGQFLPGNKGGGRPKGSKDKLNTQVINTLERLWASKGEEIMEELAATKPEVLVAMVSRLIPQQLAAEAITGEEGDKSNQINDIRVTLVHKADEPALPAREVEGELLPNDSVH